LGRHVERDDLVFAAKVDDARLDVWCILLRPSLYEVARLSKMLKLRMAL
jgi:hypothetical protein